MSSVVWDYKGVILQEYMVKRTTINSQSYLEIYKKKKSKGRVHRIRGNDKSLCLKYDNTRPHTCAFTLANGDIGFEVVKHLPPSPDLAPRKFQLFSRLKCHFERIHFQNDVEVIAEARK